MTEMWEAVVKTAKRLDVQVFATTHNQDCIRSIAYLHDAHSSLCEDVRLFRIESDRPEAVCYTPDEIAIAAREHMELRG